MRQPIRRLFCVTALVAFLFVPRAGAQIGTGGFDGCGTMVQGVECTLFSADAGGLYILLGAGQVAVGERLHVAGTVDPGCISFCQQGNGCLIATTVGECQAGIRSCEGDGGDQMGCTDCPCGNDAPAGTPGGCLNATGESAELDALGVASVFFDTLQFRLQGGNPGTFGVLVSGDDLLPQNPLNPCPVGSGVQSVALDGLRCVGGSLLRHGSRATDASGDVGFTNAGWGGPDGPSGGLIAQGGFAAGQARSWQVFYREQAALGCQTGQNTSNAVSITFTNVVIGPPPF